VEAEKVRAGNVLEKAKEQLPGTRWGSKLDVERLLKQYILSVFAVFAHEACDLGRSGVWNVVKVHSECLLFLRGFTNEAYSDKGYDTNDQRLTVPFLTDKDLRDWPEWKKYEDERLEVAQLQSVPHRPASESRPAILDQVPADGLQNTDDAANVRQEEDRNPSTPNSNDTAPDRQVDQKALVEVAPMADGASAAAAPANPEQPPQQGSPGQLAGGIPRDEAGGESSTNLRREKTDPTDEQVAVVERKVQQQADVTIKDAAAYLRCTVQHVRRLAHQGTLIASKTVPKRITSESLKAYKWQAGNRTDSIQS